MRVIAGELKGRIIHETHGHKTHPMSEKIRGALFNALGDVNMLSCLDAFGGTGAVTVEAVSRGVSEVCAVDSDREAYQTILKNTKGLPIKVSQANISSWLETNNFPVFDIVIADPPYDDVKSTLLEKVANATKPGGIFVVSLPSEFVLTLNSQFSLLKTHAYGDAKLAFYRRLS